MSRVVFPEAYYIDEVIQLHSQMGEFFKEAIFFTNYHLPAAKTIIGNRPGNSYTVFVDFNENHPENAIRAYLVFDSNILRFIRFDIAYAALFPANLHSEQDIFKGHVGISYSQILQWKNARSKLLIRFTHKKTTNGKADVLFDIETLEVPNDIDDIGQLYSKFPDIKVLIDVEIPSSLKNFRYSLVGKMYYAPLTTKEKVYCVLFAENNNAYDNNAIKVLRWIPKTKSMVLDNQANIRQAMKSLENYRSWMETDKSLIESGYSNYQKDYNQDKLRLEGTKKRIKRLEAQTSIGDYFYELGYISKSENSELHSFMVKNNSRLLFGQLEIDKITLIGGLDTFDKTVFYLPLCIERIVNHSSNKSSTEWQENFNATINLNNEAALKKIILDSFNYSEKFPYLSVLSVNGAYNLRNRLDELGVTFDYALEKVIENEKAIQVYKKEQYGHCYIFDSDYIEIVTKNSALYRYIEVYEKEKEYRNKVKKIQTQYYKGFEIFYGSINIDNYSLSDIISILENESFIQIKHNEIEEADRRRIEAERKRQEEIRIKHEIDYLKTCITGWIQPSKSTVRCFSIFYYYPTTCEWNASEDEWYVRSLIWNFKAMPHNYQSESEIKRRHANSVNEVIPLLKKVLRHYFGSNVSKLTFVPILASTKLVSERRYKDLSEQLTGDLCMYNGYPHITIIKDGISKNDPSNTMGHSIQPEFSLEDSFFKGKYVILFDDVITTGTSMERFKLRLESAGATVIGGLSIGKTKHERQESNPIDRLGEL